MQLPTQERKRKGAGKKEKEVGRGSRGNSPLMVLPDDSPGQRRVAARSVCLGLEDSTRSVTGHLH